MNKVIKQKKPEIDSNKINKYLNQFLYAKSIHITTNKLKSIKNQKKMSDLNNTNTLKNISQTFYV